MRRTLICVLGLILVWTAGCGLAAPEAATPIAPAAPYSAPDDYGLSAIPTATPAVQSPAAKSAPSGTPVQNTPAPTGRPAAAAAPAPLPSGSVGFTDIDGPNDALIVRLKNVPPIPPGTDMHGWLIDSNGQPFVKSGHLMVGPDGSADAEISAEHVGHSLIGHVNGFIITFERSDMSHNIPSDRLVFSGQLADDALMHLRHALVTTEETPNKIGQVLGLKAQVAALAEHVRLQSLAFEAKNLYEVKWHVEHIVNLVEGNQGEHYGDIVKDGALQNPGDGYGLLHNGSQWGYIAGLEHHAGLAGALPDATDAMKVHSQNVLQIIGNLEEWAEALDQRQLAILEAKTLAEMEPLVRQSQGLVQRIKSGFDANGNEKIEPVKGEGGTDSAYAETQMMAEIPLQPGSALLALNPAWLGNAAAVSPVAATIVAPAAAASSAGHGPTAAGTPCADSHGMPAPSGSTAPAATPGPSPAPSPTTPPVAAAANPGLVTVPVTDHSFGSALNIRAGTTVVWINQGKVPHTITADSGEFASEVLQPGATFGFTFTKPGTYRYYCELHGGRGGVGMAGTVVVQP